MDWQGVVAALVVLGAVLFIVRRVTGWPRRRRPPARTFVPIDRVRHRKDGCH